MKKRIICMLLTVIFAFSCFSIVPVSASQNYDINFTTPNGWLCAGDATESPIYSNEWGFYLFDDSGASVVCSEKGFTNIMYKISNVDFDKVKGMYISVDAVSARWDIKLKKGSENEVSYSGVWNGIGTNENLLFYDFSKYNWNGTDDLCIYFYSIGADGEYVKFKYAALSGSATNYTVGDSIPTNSVFGWSANGNAIVNEIGTTKNGSYLFSDSGINITCVQETLFYFNISTIIRNVDLSAVKGLSYVVDSPNTSRWEIKVFNLSDNKNSAQASGVWNGFAGSRSGYVDFTSLDWNGLSDIRIELFAVGDKSSATFKELSFISLDGSQDAFVNTKDQKDWNLNSVSGSGSFGFSADGLTLYPDFSNQEMFYSLSTKKFYLNLNSIKGIEYYIGAKNTRWVLEINNTTAGETIRINPTWAGNYGSRIGFYDFSQHGWSGNANIIITLSAVGLEGASSVSLRALKFYKTTPQEIPKLPEQDRTFGDVTGEGDFNLNDIIAAAKNEIYNNGDNYSDADGDGTVSPDDISAIKTALLNDKFFDNPNYSYTLPQGTVVELDCTTLDNYEKTMVTALQGLANRKGPRMFLQTGLTSYLNVFDLYGYGEGAFEPGFLQQYGSGGVEAFWADEIKRIYGYNFLKLPLNAVVDIFSDSYDSLVLYDETVRDENGNVKQSVSRTNSAITAAGVYSAIPVTTRLKGRFHALRNQDTALDLRSRFTNLLESTQWAIDNILPNCSTEFASSYFYEGENGTWQNDYAVMNKAFCYELNSVVAGNLNHVGEEEAKKYNPAEEVILNRILGHIEDFGFVWGWGQGGENALASVTALHGLELLCANMANASFYAGLKTEKQSLIQPYKTDPDNVTVEKKFYISFMMNEGDTYKAMANLYGGTWTQNARGQLPIAWGIDPLVLDLFPFFSEYYFDESTPNDYYFAAASGYGYIHPYFFPADMLSDYALKIKTGAIKYGIEYADIWWFSLPGQIDKWQWYQTTGLKGLTQWQNKNTTEYKNGMPIIYSELYYPSITLWTDKSYTERAQLLADSLRTAQSKIQNKTFCTVIYGGEPQYFKDIADNLPPDKFEIVPLDELYIIASKSQSEVSGITVDYDFEKASAGDWDPAN